MNADLASKAAGFELTSETLGALTILADLVTKWTRRINLVSRSSVESLWLRHIVDSAQLLPLCPPTARRFVDLGSGAGFPGIVLAIIAQQRARDHNTVLIESDQRKAAFLREAIRLTRAPAEVLCARVEHVPTQQAEVVTARALAPLPILLGHVSAHLAPNGVAALPKGASFHEEIACSRVDWAFDVEVFPSQTDVEARLLRITHLTRVIGSKSAS